MEKKIRFSKRHKLSASKIPLIHQDKETKHVIEDLILNKIKKSQDK